MSQNQKSENPPVASKADASKNAPPSKSADPIKGVAAVALRNHFYRDGYRILKFAMVLQASIILLLGLVILYMVMSKKIEYVYFATTGDGRLVKMSPLYEPNLSAPAIVSWAAQAAAQTMTFGFHDYRKRLQESSRFFTRPGWGKFAEALEASGIMAGVEENRQVVMAIPSSAPTIIQEGIVNGRYEWLLEIPMNVTYKSGDNVRMTKPLVRLKIVRVAQLENPHGIGIEQWLE